MPYCSSCGGFHAEDAEFCPFCGSPVGDDVRPVRYAGFWRRVGGSIIDSLVVGVPTSVVVGLFGGNGLRSHTTTNAAGDKVAHFDVHWSRFLVVTALQLVVPWLYAAFMQSSSQRATVGMMAIGAQVTDLQGNGISFGRASLRYLAYLVLEPLTLGIGLLLMLWTRRKQTLHDLVAHTVVVMKD